MPTFSLLSHPLHSAMKLPIACLADLSKTLAIAFNLFAPLILHHLLHHRHQHRALVNGKDNAADCYCCLCFLTVPHRLYFYFIYLFISWSTIRCFTCLLKHCTSRVVQPSCLSSPRDVLRIRYTRRACNACTSHG